LHVDWISKFTFKSPLYAFITKFQLIKFDLQTRHVFSAQAQHRGDFVHEPTFVPRPVQPGITVTEDDGVLLMPVTNVLKDQLNRLVILDAKTLDILATCSLDKFLAFGFHGLFIESSLMKNSTWKIQLSGFMAYCWYLLYNII